MRRFPLLVCVALFVFGCSTCGDDGPAPVPTSTRPPEIEEPAPEPPPDPCITTDAALASWNESAPFESSALPTSAGGEPLEQSAVIHVGDTVHRSDDELGTIEEAIAALRDAELPEDEPIVLALRASDPVSRVAPIIRAFEDRTFALVIVETDRETECRLLRQITFGLKTDEDHGWVTFPTTRPVSDLLTALGGADIPRRIQLME